MRVIRKQCGNGERSNEEVAASSGNQKELWDVLDDCTIQEGSLQLEEANDTHWEVYDSAVDESTSNDDEDYHDQANEVHEKEYVQQNKISHSCYN